MPGDLAGDFDFFHRLDGDKEPLDALVRSDFDFPDCAFDFGHEVSVGIFNLNLARKNAFNHFGGRLLF